MKTMVATYLGVDIAGAKNTWVSGLSADADHLCVAIAPHLSSMREIVQVCKHQQVVAVTIDAQLTVSLSAEKGFRISDKELRDLLPADCQNWVASVNSLMAVPIRGRILSDHLAPIVGTLLETHPRASLLFGLGNTAKGAVRSYKKGPRAPEHVSELWRLWSERFNITSTTFIDHDGALDALVCATVAYLYHHAPQELLKLRHGSQGVRGRGPFYVVAPGRSP